MGNYTIFEGLENPRRGRQVRNFTTNIPKILDLKSSSEQIFSKNRRWVPLKPTPRSETARLISNVFRALGIVSGFLRPNIITMFNTMAVKPAKALKTQFAMIEVCINNKF